MVPVAVGQDFATDVHPILTSRCAACHSGPSPQGGLALGTREQMVKGGESGPAVVPGKSSTSLLIQRVTGEVKPLMPMGAAPLTAAEIATVRAWIDKGAPASVAVQAGTKWSPTLALKVVTAPDLDSLVTPTPVGSVPDEVFLRRVYLDVWGLLPTPEQRASFLADQSASKRSSLVRALLANRQNFAEHWISFWNDLLHNDEGVTYIGDRKSITKWLLGALSSNMPYNRMVATLLNPPDAETEGFIMGVNWRGDINASQTPVMQAAQNSAQVFLGVNLKCNSCHDSFISSWKLKDAYGLASFFSDQPLEIARCDVKTGKFSSPSFLYPQLGGVAADATLAERRRAAAELFTKRENGRFARTVVNRLWQKLMGRGLVEPVDDLDAKPANPELLDWLAASFVEHGYDLDSLIGTILTSKAYAQPAGDGSLSGPQYRRLTSEQFADAVSSLTGEWRILGSTKAGPGTYSRDWRFKTNPMGRALGRPTRDLAVTSRNNDATMLQMLELVNGSTLDALVQRGAKRLLGTLPSAPEPLFDSGVLVTGPATATLKLSGPGKLYLLAQDAGSYDPTRVTATWKVGAETWKVDSVPARRTISRSDTEVTVSASVDKAPSDVNSKVRFYIFNSPPDEDRLTPASNPTPVPQPPSKLAPVELVERLYLHAYSRQPSEAERRVALQILESIPGEAGLEDLLWGMVLTPEFQYIR